MAISENKQDLRVLVVTPLGKGGMGGIDRIMDDIRPRVASPTTDGVVVDFIASRGQGSIALAPLHMAATLARLGAARLGIGRVDVVHINLSSHGSALRKLAIAKAAHWLGLPYIIHLHGSGFRKYWDAAPAPLALRIRQMFAGAARILVLGRVWRDYVAGQAPEAAKLIVILPNASSAPPPALIQQATAGQAPVILFLGHVGPRKGVPELLLALAALPKSPGWRAIIAGNGAVEQARAEIARLGLADRVEAPGWVGPDQVRGLLAASDIVVLPSHEENLPMSVIEGMAFGRAVVATPVGAVEDIIEDGKTGLLVPVGDADALAKALTRLVADPALRASLGGAAAAFHRANLDMELYVARLKSLWGEAARERRA
jgi:glycosyltransferase involved in cell wall biosynthesis